MSVGLWHCCPHASGSNIFILFSSTLVDIVKALSFMISMQTDLQTTIAMPGGQRWVNPASGSESPAPVFFFCCSIHSSTTTTRLKSCANSNGRAFTLRSRVQQRQTDELTPGPVLSRRSTERQRERNPDRWVLMGTSGHLGKGTLTARGCAQVCLMWRQTAAPHRRETGKDLCGIKKERKYSQKLQRVGIFAFVKPGGKKKRKRI